MSAAASVARASMLGTAADSLGMSFETDRSLAVIEEFWLTGLASANFSNPQELLEKPSYRELFKTKESAREFRPAKQANAVFVDRLTAPSGRRRDNSMDPRYMVAARLLSR
jgi:hypothetical protein